MIYTYTIHGAARFPYLSGGARLLDDIFDDVVGSAAALVVSWLAFLEELQGGESTHAVLLGEVLVRVAVHLRLFGSIDMYFRCLEVNPWEFES